MTQETAAPLQPIVGSALSERTNAIREQIAQAFVGQSEVLDQLRGDLVRQVVPRIEHRAQDAVDLQAWIRPGLDLLDGIDEGREPLERVVLALHGDQHAFGRHQRVITCQCERSNEPSLVQALHISNGETIMKKLASKEGRVESLLTSGLPNYRIIEELYLSALARYPTDRELAELLAVLNAAPTDERRAVVEDAFWAVLSSREFLFNH